MPLVLLCAEGLKVLALPVLRWLENYTQVV